MHSNYDVLKIEKINSRKTRVWDYEGGWADFYKYRKQWRFKNEKWRGYIWNDWFKDEWKFKFTIPFLPLKFGKAIFIQRSEEIGYYK